MSNTTKMKQMFAGENKAFFTKYFDGNLWYAINYIVPDISGDISYETPETFEFPVPISDIGTATFLANDKAMLFMRYIRKHLELIDAASKEVENQAPSLISSLIESIGEPADPPSTQKVYIHYFEKPDERDDRDERGGMGGGDPGDGAIKPGVM